MIELRHLSKEFGGAAPLKDVSLTVGDGEVVAVIGPSGVGKSTLLRCMNLLETPSGGQIFLDGEEITAPGYDVRAARRKMGMVFQSFNLFGHLTVVENVMLAPMDLLGVGKQEAYDRAMALLRQVGMADRALSYPEELSGGQKQRVAIARALAMDPEIILFDEPTSALDPTMTAEVQRVIRDLAGSGKTMVIVTHEMEFARAIASRILYVDEGGIYEDGTPEQVFDHPRGDRTRRFLRRLRVLELNIRSRDYDFIGAMAELESYCLRCAMPGKVRTRVLLAFEELTQQILLPRLPKPEIRVTAEYSEEERRAGLTFLYNGPDFDPADTDNTLAYTLLKGVCAELEHGPAGEEGFTNRCRLTIREDGGENKGGSAPAQEKPSKEENHEI